MSNTAMRLTPRVGADLDRLVQVTTQLIVDADKRVNAAWVRQASGHDAGDLEALTAEFWDLCEAREALAKAASLLRKVGAL